MVNKRGEKDLDRDAISNKKRRTSNANDQATKVLKDDIYTKMIHFEESEVDNRPSNKDAAVFLEVCEKLKGIFGEIAQLKGQTSAKAQEEIKTKRVHGSFLLTMFKKLNRLDKVRLRTGRDALHKEKMMVDTNKLQLQNLLYEADHLRREVQHCLQFKSRDEEIDLVSEESFYENAPETISNPDKTRTDEHARRLARLDWELQQRKELAEMCQQLQMTKESVAKKIESKSNRLRSLVPCLEQLLKATRPLQQALDMNIEKEWEVEKVARLLPRPLYVIYMNLSAYAEVSNRLFEIKIVGNEEEAKDLNEAKDSKNYDKIAADDDDHSSSQSSSSMLHKHDNDDDDDEHDGQRSKKIHHHNRPHCSEQINIYEAHPLSVSFKISATDKNGPHLLITLYYLPVPRMVTIRADLSNLEINGIAARCVIDPENILNCLAENLFDESDKLHPKMKYTLLHLSVEPSVFLMKLGEKKLGKPFTWVQKLCGLHYLTAGKSSALNPNSEEPEEMVPEIITQMNNRLRYRYQLYRQILALEKKSFAEFLKKSSLYAKMKPNCILAQWSPITFIEYCEKINGTNSLIEENLVTDTYLLYHAVIIRGAAKMECFISVSPNFPAQYPMWVVCLNSNGMRYDSTNNQDIKDIEFWTNSINASERNASNILIEQLMRLMHSLDVYLDTESTRMTSTHPPNEIREIRQFPKVFRGRTRARPYKMIQNGNSIMHTQI